MMNDQVIDQMQDRLRSIFEIKSGYKDEAAQARLLEKHFKVSVDTKNPPPSATEL